MSVSVQRLAEISTEPFRSEPTLIGGVRETVQLAHRCR